MAAFAAKKGRTARLVVRPTTFAEKEGKEMSDEQEAGSTRRPANRTDLGQHYREIGISALAATLPYWGAQKNNAYAPAKQQILTIRDLERLFG
jgi:hypothetical protein